MDDQKKSSYRPLGCIRENPDYPGSFFVTIQNEDRTANNGEVYPSSGVLFFLDKETGKTYKVNTMYLFEVDTESSGGARAYEAGIRFNVSLKMDNPKCVEECVETEESVTEETATENYTTG